MRSIHTAFSASLVSAALVTASLITLPLQAAAQTAQASAKNPATASINNATGTTAGKFPETAGPLTLNGWGTRKRLGFEVYHVGLYAQTKSVNGADHLTLAKPVDAELKGNLLEGGPKVPEGKAKMAGGPRR